MKICIKCKIEKSIDEFHKNASKKDGRQLQCKPCKKAVDFSWYEKNKFERRLLNQKSRDRNREFIREIKNAPCKDCGKKFHFSAMDFDHIYDKKKNISEMISGFSLSKIKEEISKCELVCACCHRIRTFKRSGVD